MIRYSRSMKRYGPAGYDGDAIGIDGRLRMSGAFMRIGLRWPSLRGPAAIDRQDRAGDRGRLIGAQEQIGRAHVCTPVTNAHLVCRLLLEKKNKKTQI